MSDYNKFVNPGRMAPNPPPYNMSQMEYHQHSHPATNVPTMIHMPPPTHMVSNVHVRSGGDKGGCCCCCCTCPFWVCGLMIAVF